ncbi:MAG: HD domain-containing protein [Synergistaceae bacterium]
MHLNLISCWFDNYIKSFEVSGELPQMLSLKEGHSHRVAELSVTITKSAGLNDETSLWIAHFIGLLHDVGRFVQYSKFQTFQDSVSIDHGDAAIEILEKNFDWSEVPVVVKENTLLAIKYHNKKDLPDSLSPQALFWAKVIRDADKVDIFRMIQSRIDNGTIYDMLPRHKKVSGLSSVLVEEVRHTFKGSYTNAKSLQDYRLIQMTWGIDLNFPYSVSLLYSEGIFKRIIEDLDEFGIGDITDLLLNKIIDKIKK